MHPITMLNVTHCKLNAGRSHILYRCGLRLQTSHVAWSVYLCVGHTGELCKTAKPIDMPFWGLIHVGPKNHVLAVVEIPRQEGTIFGVVRPISRKTSGVSAAMYAAKGIIQSSITA